MEECTMNRSISLFKNVGFIFSALLLLLFSISGCVSSSKYRSLESQNAMLQQEKIELAASNMRMNEELSKKKSQEQTMNQMVDDLKTEVANKSVQIDIMEDALEMKVVDKLHFSLRLLFSLQLPFFAPILFPFLLLVNPIHR